MNCISFQKYMKQTNHQSSDTTAVLSVTVHIDLRTMKYRKAGERLFIMASSNRTKGNGFKLEEERFRLDIRKKFSTVRVVRDWNRLPSEVVDAPSLEAFEARLDGAVSNLV